MKTLKLFLVFVFAVAAFSCNREKVSLSLPASQESDVYKRILALGFNKSQIVEYKDFYLVEGDMAFSKIEKFNNSSRKLKQAYDNSVYSDFGIIKVYLDSIMYTYGTLLTLEYNYPGSISNAVYEAISTWNLALWGNGVYGYDSSRGGIYFSRTYNQTEANIIISNTSMNSLGYANMPTGNGNPGSELWLNKDAFNDKGCDNVSQLVEVLVHEMGHTLGLRHTNWEAMGESEPYQTVPGTSQDDPYSIMNGHWYTDPLVGFGGYSDNDRIAIAYKYPNLFIDPSDDIDFTSYTGVWLTVFTNCPTWSASGSDDTWLHVITPYPHGSGGLNIYVDTPTGNQGYVTVSYGDGLTKTVNVN